MQPKKILYDGGVIVGMDTLDAKLICEMYADYKFLREENTTQKELLQGKDEEINLLKHVNAQDSMQKIAYKQIESVRGNQIKAYQKLLDKSNWFKWAGWAAFAGETIYLAIRK